MGELNNWGIDLWGWLAPTLNPNVFFVLEIGLPCIPLGLFRKKEKRERRGKKEEETKKGESGSKRVWSIPGCHEAMTHFGFLDFCLKYMQQPMI